MLLVSSRVSFLTTGAAHIWLASAACCSGVALLLVLEEEPRRICLGRCASLGASGGYSLGGEIGDSWGDHLDGVRFVVVLELGQVEGWRGYRCELRFCAI
ncbi:hypothetical protein V8F20_007083 [Naviculisporaceae sp. PSN 640]